MRRELEVLLPGDLSIKYVERGDLSATPVVFLHGFADSWRSFDLVLDQLPESVHAIALTQRGHGDSGKPPKGYGISDFAADLKHFLDEKRLSTVLLVGHSMGSAIASRFAIDHSERVGALVLVGAASSMRGTPEARKFWDAKLEKMSDPIDSSMYREMTEGLLAKPVPRDHLDRMARDGVKVPAFVWKQTFESRWRMEGDFESGLAEITAPTLIVWGDRDSRYPRSEQETLVKAIPTAELVVYEGAGHMLHWEEPARFASDLAAFLERTRPMFSKGDQCPNLSQYEQIPDA